MPRRRETLEVPRARTKMPLPATPPLRHVLLLRRLVVSQLARILESAFSALHKASINRTLVVGARDDDFLTFTRKQ